MARSWLWCFGTFRSDTKALKNTGVLAAQCLGSSSGGVRTLLPFWLSGFHRDLMGLFLAVGITNTLRSVVNPRSPGPSQNRSEVKSAFSRPAPQVPHAASSLSSSSKQGLSEFSTVASETSLCWLPAQL